MTWATRLVNAAMPVVFSQRPKPGWRGRLAGSWCELVSSSACVDVNFHLNGCASVVSFMNATGVSRVDMVKYGKRFPFDVERSMSIWFSQDASPGAMIALGIVRESTIAPSVVEDPFPRSEHPIGEA